jgi:hypothetical protein
MSGHNAPHVMQPVAPTTAPARDAVALGGSLSDAKSVEFGLIDQLSAKLASSRARAGWRSFASACASICRIHSRVTPNPFAESSKSLDRSQRRAKAAHKGKIRQVKKRRPEPDSTGAQCV